MAAANYDMSSQQRKALARDVRAATKAYKTDKGEYTPQQRREMKAFIEHGRKGRDIRKEGGFGA